MAKIEPGTYEPRGDDIRVFDGAEDDMDEEGSRLPLLIVIALLVLAAFGGVVYLAYTEGVQKGHSDAPRVITAQAGPAKVAPTDAGGSETPYKGLKIYEQPAPSDEDADSAPPPPTQVSPATAPPATFAQAKPTPTTTIASLPVQSAQQKPTQGATIAPLPATAKPTPTLAVTATKPVTKPETATAAPRSLTTTAQTTTKPAAVGTKPAPTPAATSPAAPGAAYVLQIGSYKSEAEATAAFEMLKHKNSALMSGFSANVKQVDLGDKGTWYRLRVGSFADKDAAAALCQRLGGGCFPAKP